MIVYEISKHSNEHVVALFSTVQYCFQTKVHPIWSLSSTTYNIITICFHFPHISFLFFPFRPQELVQSPLALLAGPPVPHPVELTLSSFVSTRPQVTISLTHSLNLLLFSTSTCKTVL